MQPKFVGKTNRALPKSQKFKEESESFRKLLNLIKPQVKSRKKTQRIYSRVDSPGEVCRSRKSCAPLNFCFMAPLSGE